MKVQYAGRSSCVSDVGSWSIQEGIKIMLEVLCFCFFFPLNKNSYMLKNQKSDKEITTALTLCKSSPGLIAYISNESSLLDKIS